MINKGAQNSYDQIPYPSLSYSQTHPDNLAAIATLFNINPPPIEHCRVLELGCASGGNIVPMAYGLSESEFVGVDSSGVQIADGQAMIKALGLINITLKHLNILNMDAKLGQFDYIIAHGIYSWVAPQVQEEILRICRRYLAPTGVAYISYNTYPGWNMLKTGRDIMLFHTRHLTEPSIRATQARALMDFLTEATLAKNNLYSGFLKYYRNLLMNKTAAFPDHDAFLLHDELEEVNDPIYFHEFNKRVDQHNLQYLAEAEFSTMLINDFPPEVSETLRQISNNIIEFEQYLDFLKNRSFRQTLLCHREISLSRNLNPERLTTLYISSPARPLSSTPAIHSDATVQFRAPDETILSTDHPITKAAMLYLHEIWPQAIAFNALLAKAYSRLGIDATLVENTNLLQDTRNLGTNLLRAYGYSSQLVKLHAHSPKVTCEIGERPVVSALARHQARHGSPTVTNLRHERVDLNKFDHHLLGHLDGNHNHTELIQLLEKMVTEGVLDVKQNDEPVQNSRLVRSILAEKLDLHLNNIAKAALLIG
jgi:methyltransferase-like protein/SAM-dependent methyltransferase